MANNYNYNTSSAYKFDYNYLDQQIKNKRNAEMEARNKKKEIVMSQKQSREKRIKAFAMVVALFVLSFIVINRYVEINEARNAMNQLRNEYNSIVATNQALQAKIDKAVDLKKLQTMASEKFGMVRPERYQMFYIDMQQDDKAENVADKKAGDEREKIAVQGVPGTLISNMKMFK